MPGNVTSNINQNQALLMAGAAPQGTHHNAAQASAARFIAILREAYPETDMQERVDDTVKPIETTARINAEQQKLHDFLNQQIASFEKVGYNSQEEMLEEQLQEKLLQEYMNNVQSPLHGTLNMIVHISALETYPTEDILHVLMQILDIAKNCPGFTWSQDDRHWSINTIFDAASEKVLQVIASPAETLNLVCRAIFDEKRYPQKSFDGKSASENQSLRIDSFFHCLHNLYKLKNEQQREKCSGGVQHDLLTLLNLSYHDKPCSHSDAKVIEWIDNTSTFIFEKLTLYVAGQLTQSSEESVIIDWIKFQETPLTDDIEETRPLISFLRRIHPTQGDDPDTTWKSHCEDYLSLQCKTIGLSPYLCPINEIIEAISTIQPPDLEGGLTSMMIQLMQAKPIQNPSNSALIEKRNHTILCFQKNLDKSQWDSIKQTVTDLFISEEVFQIFFQNHQLMLFVDSSTDASIMPFKIATERLQLNLTNFYDKTAFDTQVFSEVKTEYIQQLKAYKERCHADYVESFFANFNRATYNPAADTCLRELGMIDDEVLTKWNNSQVITQTYFDFTHTSVYEVNRLLLHALSTPVSNWSMLFCNVLLKLVHSLVRIEENMNPRIQALKNSIRGPLLENFVLVACVQQSDTPIIKYSADNDEIKAMLSTALSEKLNEEQFKLIFDSLLKRKAEVFIGYHQIVHFLRRNLSTDDQNTLINTLPISLYGPWGILALFKLSQDQLCHDAREGFLLNNRVQICELIPTIFKELFALPIANFSQSERNTLFNPASSDSKAVTYNFNAIIPRFFELHNLFALSMEQLSAAQRTAILKSIERRLPYYFNNCNAISDLFSLTMEKLTEKNREDIFQAIQSNLAHIPAIELLHLLSKLSSEQLTLPLENKIVEIVIQDVTNIPQLRKYLKLSDKSFPENFKRRLAAAKENDLKNLVTEGKHIYDLLLILSNSPYFSPEQIWVAVSDSLLKFSTEPHPDIPLSLLEICMILEQPEGILCPDSRAFICDTLIESKIKTVTKRLEVESITEPYVPFVHNGIMPEEIKAHPTWELISLFSPSLIARSFKLSDKQITKSARESLFQLYLFYFNKYVFDIVQITQFLDLSLLEFTEEQRHTLIRYALEKKSSLFSDFDNLCLLFSFPTEKLSDSLCQSIIKKSNFSWIMNAENLTKLQKLFDNPFTPLSFERKKLILSLIFEHNPHFSNSSNIPHKLQVYSREVLSFSELSTKQRTVYWNRIRPLSGDDFPDIPGGEVSLGRAIVAQHYQAALDAVFRGAKLKDSIAMHNHYDKENGEVIILEMAEIVDGLSYLDDVTLFDETISDSLRYDLTMFTNNLLLAEKLTSFKQCQGYGLNKHTRPHRFFTPNTSLAPYLLESIFELQHAMIQEPLHAHLQVQTFIQRYSEKRVEFFPIASANTDLDALIFKKRQYNGQTLGLKLKQLEALKDSQLALDFARAVGSQLILSLFKIRCFGGSVFEYIQPDNIVISEDGRVLIDANLLLKRTNEPHLQSETVLMNRVARIIYTIACHTSWNPVLPLNLSPKNIAHQPLRLILEKMQRGDSWLTCTMDKFFSSHYIFSSQPQLKKKMNEFESIENNREVSSANKDALRTLLPALTEEAIITLKVSIPLPVWFKKERNLTPNVALVSITSEEKRTKLKLSDNDYYILKTLELYPDQDRAAHLRRAIGIMEKSHHPGIIRMVSVTRENNRVDILCDVCEAGTLQYVLSKFPKSSGTPAYISMILAVTCQVLNTLVFLQSKLNIAHQDITPEHILFTQDGRVKLCGFNASGNSLSTDQSDMKQLSGMLLKLLPGNLMRPTQDNQDEANCIKSAREFATWIANRQPYEALQHIAMKKYYDETDEIIPKLKIELKALNVFGDTPVEEMKSWKEFDDKNTTSGLRFSIRAKMKELCLRRVMGSVTCVRSNLQYIEPQIEQRFNEWSTVKSMQPY